jgi:hypothetical protein
MALVRICGFFYNLSFILTRMHKAGDYFGQELFLENIDFGVYVRHVYHSVSSGRE